MVGIGGIYEIWMLIEGTLEKTGIEPLPEHGRLKSLMNLKIVGREGLTRDSMCFGRFKISVHGRNGHCIIKLGLDHIVDCCTVRLPEDAPLAFAQPRAMYRTTELFHTRRWLVE